MNSPSKRPFNVFSDSVYRNHFFDQGYVGLPKISENQLCTLIDLYKSIYPFSECTLPLFRSFDLLDQKKMLELRVSVLDILQGYLSNTFKAFDAWSVNFIVKNPGAPKVPPHQDWIMVDEQSNFSALLYIPLQDMHSSNGTMLFLDKSHDILGNRIRGSFFAGDPDPHFSKLANAAEAIMSNVKLHAGTPVLFNNATVHGSLPNMSDSQRVALVVGITTPGSKLFHYQFLPPSKANRILVRKYSVDYDFYLKNILDYLNRHYDNGKVLNEYELLDEFVLNPLGRSQYESILKSYDLKLNL